MTDYLGITTFPSHTSGNVGDKLITDSGIRILEKVKGKCDVSVYYRGRDLTPIAQELNEARAILLFGFPLKERRTKPDLYKLVDSLDSLDTPIIPLGTALSFFPGTQKVREGIRFGKGTLNLLDRCRQDSPEGRLSARTSWVEEVLRRHGYPSVMTGDMAWYHPDHVGEPLHTPDEIRRLVFTPPHGPMYLRQALNILSSLTDRFPDAERIVSYQSWPTSVDQNIQEVSTQLEWKQKYTSHSTRKISFYSDSDLHVGYRKHGHLAHLRLRRPSVLLAEDSRGVGLLETLGGGGIPAFRPRFADGMCSVARRGLSLGREFIGRTNIVRMDVGKSYENMLLGKPKSSVESEVIRLVEQQLDEGWALYKDMMKKIDQTYYEVLVPFIERIP